MKFKIRLIGPFLRESFFFQIFQRVEFFALSESVKFLRSKNIRKVFSPILRKIRKIWKTKKLRENIRKLRKNKLADRKSPYPQLAKLCFDKILDLTAGGVFIPTVCSSKIFTISLRLRQTSPPKLGFIYGTRNVDTITAFPHGCCGTNIMGGTSDNRDYLVA